MCGIVGIYSIDGLPVNVRALCHMTDSQRHRGPDDQGIRLFSFKQQKTLEIDKDHISSRDWASQEYEGGIGFNRLSILDLSLNGHQPMLNDNGRIIIALNGEVYNAFDYRTELEAAGFRFKSTTDTEVVLYLYEHHGLLGMLERLNGMFAICIVDLDRQEIYIARDRLGIKPLYWWQNSGTFLFSSEIKSFLRHPCFRAELDADQLDEYFAFRYIAGNNTLLNGVHTVGPGCWMRLWSGGWEQRRYWTIPDGIVGEEMPFDMAVQELEAHLRRSVSMQLLSDVKVGCQLSGGIDSTLVTVFAAWHDNTDMDTFSIVLDDMRLSEEKWIDDVTAISNMQSHKYKLDSSYFLKNLGKATWHLDHPLNHPNSLGILKIAEEARHSVTVLLSGEGADESFGGYARFYSVAYRLKFGPWMRIMRYLPYVGAKLFRRFGVQEYPEHYDYIDWFIAASAFQRSDHLLRVKPDACFDKVISKRRAIFEQGKGDAVSNCLKYELQTYLVECLVRQDKMTMAHSVENRVPFLDNQLLEFVRGLPSRYLVRTGHELYPVPMFGSKVILKAVGLKYFDSDFVFRPKAGFGLPLRSFLADERFTPVMEDLLLPGMRDRGIVSMREVEHWWRNLKSESEAVVEALWICIAFEIWAQQFLGGKRGIL